MSMLRTIDHSLYVETVVDELLHMVREKVRVNVKDAAKAFAVSKEQIEEWGIILEDHKLIKMHYPPMGDAILEAKSKKVKK